MRLSDQIGFGALGIICSSSYRDAYSPEISGQSLLLSLAKSGPIGCGVMAAVMMTPLAIGPARRLALASPRHAWQALAVFLMGYGGVWLVAGVLAQALISAISTRAPSGAAGAELALLAALAWELTPAKRRALDACRKDVLAGRSRVGLNQGEAISCGARHGLNCALSCGVMMFAAAFVERGHLAAMMAITAICIAQRFWPTFARLIGVSGLAGLALGYFAGGPWLLA